MSKPLGLKTIFRLACKNNILYDGNIFDHVLYDYLDDRDKQYAYIGDPYYDEWLSQNYIRTHNCYDSYDKEISVFDDNEKEYIIAHIIQTRLFGKLQSIFDRPAYKRSYYCGSFYYHVKSYLLKWFNDGKIHRSDDKPAMMVYVFTNSSNLYINYKKWYKDGLIHRNNDLPAKITYFFRSKKIQKYEWYKNGIRDRSPDLNGMPQPAIIEFERDGFIKNKIWILNGVITMNNNYKKVYW